MSRIIELGWKARLLALPCEYDGAPVVPIIAQVDSETLRISRNVYGIHDPVLWTGVNRPPPAEESQDTFYVDAF